jgi:hypothetical protein
MRAIVACGRSSERLALTSLIALLVTRPAVAEERPPQVQTSTTSETSSAPSSSGDIANHALWAGMRFGAFVPYGGLYAERTLAATPFQDVATGGPAAEIDIGVRFARRFVGYGFFEQVWLGRGTSPAWTTPHQGQVGASTQAIGIGMRYISDPSGLGFVADVGLSYRWFSARWADATTVRMHGFGDVRVGLGANWRFARHVALAPMATVYTGAFSERHLDGEPLGEAASSYVATALTLGAYIDL